MARQHYHVMVGLRGVYMPDVNDVYTSKRSAIAGARWHAENWNEGSDTDPMIRHGSGLYYSRHNLIEIRTCTDSDCKGDHD